MTESEYNVWRPYAVSGYAQEFVDAGILDPKAAAGRAEKDFDALLTDGLATADHLIWSVHAPEESAPVGAIWVKLMTDRTPSQAYVYAVDVFPAYRRRGFGQAIMAAAIEECKKRGVGSLGLNVFGHNHTARRIYDRLGFRVTSTSMKLDL